MKEPRIIEITRYDQPKNELRRSVIKNAEVRRLTLFFTTSICMFVGGMLVGLFLVLLNYWLLIPIAICFGIWFWVYVNCEESLWNVYYKFRKIDEA